MVNGGIGGVGSLDMLVCVFMSVAVAVAVAVAVLVATIAVAGVAVAAYVVVKLLKAPRNPNEEEGVGECRGERGDTDPAGDDEGNEVGINGRLIFLAGRTGRKVALLNEGLIIGGGGT